MGDLRFRAMARSSVALALLLCSALFLNAVVIADEPEVQGVEEDTEKEAKEELDRMDADKDGKVSLDEIQNYFRSEFYSDEDMKDSTEGADGKPPTQAEIAELVKNDATEFLTELDKDKDGFLNLEELEEQYNTSADDLEEDDEHAAEDEHDEAEDMGENDVEDE